MLVLSRKQGQSIVIDSRITVTVLEVRGDKVKIGVDAPPDVKAFRQEIWLRIDAEKQAAENEKATTVA